jgi:hypothetical protein
MIMKFINSLLLLAILFASVNISKAQVNTLSELIADEGNNQTLNQSESIEQLALGNVPTAYVLNNDILKSKPSKPNRIYVDTKSIDFDWNKIGDLSGVSILVIQMNDKSDLDQVIDLKRFASLTNLKYLYFRSSIELCTGSSDTVCEKQVISKMIKGKPSKGLSIVYSIESNQ